MYSWEPTPLVALKRQRTAIVSDDDEEEKDAAEAHAVFRLAQMRESYRYSLAQLREDEDDVDSYLIHMSMERTFARPRTMYTSDSGEHSTQTVAAAADWLGQLAFRGAPVSRRTVAVLLDYCPCPARAQEMFRAASNAGTLALVLEFIIKGLGVPAHWRSGGPISVNATAVLHQMILLERNSRPEVLDHFMQAQDPELALKTYTTIFPAKKREASAAPLALSLLCHSTQSETPLALASPDIIRHIALLATAANNGIFT